MDIKEKITNKKASCHDCNKEIEMNGEEIKNGVLLSYKTPLEEIMAFKCNECFEKSPSLTNYQNCEVYSRVVGYLRPVEQWNEGKKKEFEDRVEYTAPRCCSCPDC